MTELNSPSTINLPCPVEGIPSERTPEASVPSEISLDDPKESPDELASIDSPVVSSNTLKIVYPLSCRRKGIEGTVTLHILVGTVVQAEVVTSSGNELLDKAAVEAAEQAHYSAMGELTLSVEFRLR